MKVEVIAPLTFLLLAALLVIIVLLAWSAL